MPTPKMIAKVESSESHALEIIPSTAFAVSPPINLLISEVILSCTVVLLPKKYPAMVTTMINKEGNENSA